MRNNYDLLTKTMFGYTTVASNVLPTPMLMDATYPPKPVEAYEEIAACGDMPAIWRMRDDRYDQQNFPDGVEYTTVWAVVRHAPETED